MATGFSLAVALSAAAGLLLQSGVLAGRPRAHFFWYYTNLSNLAALLYRLLWLWPGGPVRKAEVETGFTLSLLLTHLVYVFVLGPHYTRRGLEGREASLPARLLYPLTLGGDFRALDGRNPLGNLLVHYVTPLLALAGWLLTADKGLSPWFMLWWLALPGAYLAAVCLRARSGVPLRAESLYPYRFLDREALGPAGFRRSVGLTAAGCGLLGLVFYILSLAMR